MDSLFFCNLCEVSICSIDLSKSSEEFLIEDSLDESFLIFKRARLLIRESDAVGPSISS